MFHRKFQASHITRIDPPIEAPPGPRPVMAAFGPGDAQHSRTHHWSQREGDQQTDQHRCSRSDSELIEEASGNARHKGHGYENNDEAESRGRSEEHTSELQSPCNLVCRLLLEKKKTKHKSNTQRAVKIL